MTQAFTTAPADAKPAAATAVFDPERMTAARAVVKGDALTDVSRQLSSPPSAAPAWAHTAPGGRRASPESKGTNTSGPVRDGPGPRAAFIP